MIGRVCWLVCSLPSSHWPIVDQVDLSRSRHYCSTYGLWTLHQICTAELLFPSVIVGIVMNAGLAEVVIQQCFLPCDAMRCTVFAIVILSVRLSVTLVDCVHMVRPTIMISSPYDSPIILISGDIKFIPKFEGDHPEQGR